MMTLADRIFELLKQSPGLTDRQIADTLMGAGRPQQSINIACRSLERRGVLSRQRTSTGCIANYLTDREPRLPATQTQQTVVTRDAGLSEDAIKRILEEWLIAQGWNVKVAWGHDRGIDIDARRAKERWVIEVKGQGSLNPMRANCFLGILGETPQRMEDANAKYSIALPDIEQFRSLWRRLPLLAKSRSEITALFVSEDGKTIEIP
jgi:hypothetical protein